MKNIFNIIKENNNKFPDTYVIEDGYVLDRETLIRNGIVDPDLKKSKKLYPIYIPGRHPIKSKGSEITYNDIVQTDSVVYQSDNFFELGISKDDNIPIVGKKVRVFYDKVDDKTFSTIYFELVDPNSKISISGNPNFIRMNTNRVNANTNANSINNSITGKSGGVARGIQLSFEKMFSQALGNIIILKNNNLALNLYAVAGKESSWFSGANGDSGVSYGLFQLNTRVHTLDFIQKYIDNAIEYFDLKEIDGIGPSQLSYPLNVNEWIKSVGYNINPYPIKSITNLNIDVQLAAWIGYMIDEKYIKRLESIPVHEDIVKFQDAQRFHISYIHDYKNSTEQSYNGAISTNNALYSQLLNFFINSKTLSKKDLYSYGEDVAYVSNFL